MRRFFAICVMLGLVGGVVGCEKKSEVKKTTTVTTPEGSTTKTDTTTVETSGEHPPAAK
jgi:hypothetical protein